MPRNSTSSSTPASISCSSPPAYGRSHRGKQAWKGNCFVATHLRSFLPSISAHHKSQDHVGCVNPSLQHITTDLQGSTMPCIKDNETHHTRHNVLAENVIRIQRIDMYGESEGIEPKIELKLITTQAVQDPGVAEKEKPPIEEIEDDSTMSSTETIIPFGKSSAEKRQEKKSKGGGQVQSTSDEKPNNTREVSTRCSLLHIFSAKYPLQPLHECAHETGSQSIEISEPTPLYSTIQEVACLQTFPLSRKIPAFIHVKISFLR